MLSFLVCKPSWHMGLELAGSKEGGRRRSIVAGRGPLNISDVSYVWNLIAVGHEAVDLLYADQAYREDGRAASMLLQSR